MIERPVGGSSKWTHPQLQTRLLCVLLRASSSGLSVAYFLRYVENASTSHHKLSSSMVAQSPYVYDAEDKVFEGLCDLQSARSTLHRDNTEAPRPCKPVLKTRCKGDTYVGTHSVVTRL